jgi:S1-C subfamily serine protease
MLKAKNVPQQLLLASLLLLMPTLAQGCVDCFACVDKCCGRCFCNCALDRCCSCCGAAPYSHAYLDGLHPGIVTGFDKGRFVVAGIIAGSPAETAGARVGDEILLINGMRPGTATCSVSAWSIEGSDKTRLVLKRADHEVDVTIHLVSVRQLFRRAWFSTQGQGQVLAANMPTPEVGEQLGPFTLGIRWKQEREFLLVTDVLRGSPADTAGILLGDHISAVDSRAFVRQMDTLLSAAVHADGPLELNLRLQRGTSSKVVTLRAVGLSTIVRNLAQPSNANFLKLAAAIQR